MEYMEIKIKSHAPVKNGRNGFKLLGRGEHTLTNHYLNIYLEQVIWLENCLSLRKGNKELP